jgi:DNA processing protein
VVSELPPGTHPTKWTFPRRNRLLAAWGDAVLVVEGSNSSGALQTAKWGADLGKTVYCVPGSIFSEASEGCNSLIHDGASSALRPDVLVEEFLDATRMERGERAATMPVRIATGEQMRLGGLTGTGAVTDRVLEALGRGPQSVDGLVTMTGLSAREVSGCLGELEVCGEVSRPGSGMFLRAP